LGPTGVDHLARRIFLPVDAELWVMIGRLYDRLSELVGSDESGRDESEEGSIWGLTPDWQLGGFRLQGSTLPRDEQQDAVREVHAQASEMERELDDQR
jgi:hypothetical protein